ncbi:NADH-quinone oxidoreductase subunit K [Thermobifida halotolerans]|uniref:NADH-quinone oxidoreductase subunit K n=1 Tax=Thermobifida halotolerans TaxID=483545 RepID=A0AA97M4K0_9ACTN|nr:NADH-quinone oxidoreductase subunit K [Thermobifida halotolerans]UOE20399.1 NADH-quinone oxidoreductase subunit K [Thermobifida halotolerans]
MNATNLTLSLVVGGLFAGGVHLLLQRGLFRIVLGFVLLGHGANLVLLIAGGPAGAVPEVGEADPAAASDPLPQAMALTAVVITFAVTALLLALCDRSVMLYGDDEVRDDVEDRLLARQERQGEET